MTFHTIAAGAIFCYYAWVQRPVVQSQLLEVKRLDRIHFRPTGGSVSGALYLTLYLLLRRA